MTERWPMLDSLTRRGGPVHPPSQREADLAGQEHTSLVGRTDRGGIRSGLWLPLFDELADPVVVAGLAAEAEEAGWHGVFVWDHLRWRAPVRQVADPWITLAAIAAVTERLRLGPMVTPLARRRPAKVVAGIQFLPQPVQQPGVPVWVGAFPGSVRPLRRAARHDGLVPVYLDHPDQLAEMVAVVAELREDTTAPYDVAVGLPLGTDPLPYAEAGATWWMPDLAPDTLSLDQVRGVVRDGPAPAP